MNILPLVSAFIILFAIFSYSFFHNMLVVTQEEFHYKNALNIERTYANSEQRKDYKRQDGKNLHPRDKKKSKKDEKKEFESPRDRFDQYPDQKLNIRDLLKNEKNLQLERIALNLIKRIYESTPIYESIKENEILIVILQTVKKNPKVKGFEDLLTKLPKEYVSRFYKLIKGTQNYEIGTNRGYPALGDFISLHPSSHKKPIHILHASRPLLTAMFDSTTASKIILEEKHKWEIDHKHVPLSKEELEAFFHKNGRNLSDFEYLLSFKKNKDGSKQEVIKSEKLQIKIHH